MRVKGSERKQ
jgi:hypothetical protein